MGTAELISLALGSGTLGYILKRIVDHLLGRGKVRADEAAEIRKELRAEITRKNEDIEAMEQRITALEAELDKAERERNLLDLQFNRYKLDVYRTLVDAGVARDLLNTVLAL